MSFSPLTSYSEGDPLDSAAISSDGKFVAFCSKGKLSIQKVRSGDQKILAMPEGFHPASASWFPDGTKLLLGRFQPRWVQVQGETIQESGSSLWSLSILGDAPKKIADHAASASISPDGSLIAFSRRDLERQTADLWLMNANGESPRRIRTPSESSQYYFSPVWSSDGQRLFYVHNGREVESCDLRGEKATTIFSCKANQALSSICLAPEGRVLLLLNESQPGLSWTADLWEIRVDTATGRPLSEARRLTQWPNFGSAQVSDLSITADGKSLVMRKGHAQGDVYVAELESDGKAIKTPRRLTLVQSDDAAWDWTADSRAVFFTSTRNGNWDIFRQDISLTEPEPIIAGQENEKHPNLSPDGAFILHLVSEKTSHTATRLMRVPVGGGPPEAVLTGKNIKDFSCARAAALCVVVEEAEGKQVLTIFDPLKGRGQNLPILDFPDFTDRVDIVTPRLLSPQGRLIEKIIPGPEGLRIRVRSLTEETVQEITFKKLIGKYLFSGWSPDGTGVYLTDWGASDSYYRMLFGGLDGHSQVLWKRGTSTGHTVHDPMPSPDGRHLAFTVITYEMNAWMLENF